MKANANIELANVSEPDFSAIQQIYAYYIEETTISLELEVPSIDELKSRRKEGYPYIVAKQNGKVAGYAYVSPYRPRGAYKYTVELSIYVDHSALKGGIGRILFEEIIRRCKELGFKQMLAVIAGNEQDNSIKFHERMGFVHCGLLKNFGWKHDQWVDTTLMQKAI